MRIEEVVTNEITFENAFTNAIEDLKQLTADIPDVSTRLGQMLGEGIVEEVIGGTFLNDELAREHVVKDGASEKVFETMLRVIMVKDLQQRIQENEWKIENFLKSENKGEDKLQEWMKVRRFAD